MSLRKLKNSELHEKLSLLAQRERKLLREVLLHIIEVDRRKLFLEKAYPNMYEYLVQGIGYSAASAQRRIDAARIMAQVPELGIKIEQGAVNLSQLSQVQKTIRFIKKNSDTKITLAKKAELIKKIENKSFKETELVLAQEFSLPEVHEEKVKVQKDESVRIEMTFSKEEMELITQAQALLGHSLEKQNLSIKSIKDLLVYCSRKVVQQKMQNKPQARDKNKAQVQVKNRDQEQSQPSVRLVGERIEKVIPQAEGVVLSQAIKNQIWQRDQYCQFKDNLTGKICGSQNYLEVDHIKPQWANGGHEIKNLRILCSSHNKHRYQIGK